MIIPSGNGLNNGNERSAENFLGKITTDYIGSLENYAKKGTGRAYWQLVGNQIHETVGNRTFILDTYDTIAFLVAFCHLEDFYESSVPSYGKYKKTFGARLSDVGFFQDNDVDTLMYRFFLGTMNQEHVGKVFPNIANHPEKVYLLNQLYRKYKDALKDGRSEDLIQEKIALGTIMILFLQMGIRPYMLEQDEPKRKEMIQKGYDWVYELAELFYDFQVDQAYYMAGFGKMYEAIKQKTLWLQEKKEQKIQNIKYACAIAVEHTLLDERYTQAADCTADYINGVVARVKRNEGMVKQSIGRLDSRTQELFDAIKK